MTTKEYRAMVTDDIKQVERAIQADYHAELKRSSVSRPSRTNTASPPHKLQTRCQRAPPFPQDRCLRFRPVFLSKITDSSLFSSVILSGNFRRAGWKPLRLIPAGCGPPKPAAKTEHRLHPLSGQSITSATSSFQHHNRYQRGRSSASELVSMASVECQRASRRWVSRDAKPPRL